MQVAGMLAVGARVAEWSSAAFATKPVSGPPGQVFPPCNVLLPQGVLGFRNWRIFTRQPA